MYRESQQGTALCLSICGESLSSIKSSSSAGLWGAHSARLRQEVFLPSVLPSHVRVHHRSPGGGNRLWAVSNEKAPAFSDSLESEENQWGSLNVPSDIISWAPSAESECLIWPGQKAAGRDPDQAEKYP